MKSAKFPKGDSRYHAAIVAKLFPFLRYTRQAWKSKKKIVSNNIETLLQKYTYNYKVETEGNTLIVRVPIEVYSVISRRCLRKLERIGRRAGFTQVSIEIMEQT